MPFCKFQKRKKKSSQQTDECDNRNFSLLKRKFWTYVKIEVFDWAHSVLKRTKSTTEHGNGWERKQAPLYTSCVLILQQLYSREWFECNKLASISSSGNSTKKTATTKKSVVSMRIRARRQETILFHHFNFYIYFSSLLLVFIFIIQQTIFLFLFVFAYPKD